LEVRQLKYFVGIVDAGSVTRASALLHVAQPALSAQVARLESELCARLLTRSVRGVTLTAAGAAVYEQAKLILKQIEATHAIVAQASQGPTGPVAVGLPWTVANVIGLRLLQEVKAAMPAVRLKIVEEPSAVLAQMLEQGKLDVAITFDGPGGAGLQITPLVEESLALVGAPGTLEGWHDCTLENLVELPLLLLSRPNGIRETVERLCLARGRQPNLVAEVNAPTLLIEAVKAGVGFAVVPTCSLDESLRLGEIDAVPIASGEMVRTLHLSTSRIFAPTQATEQVAELMVRLLHEAVQNGRWRARWIGQKQLGEP
jgi:DNA-binding transcriptional LysR family regulator